MICFLYKNFNPRAPRGARRWIASNSSSRFAISIHALREERDQLIAGAYRGGVIISIHALREERDGFADFPRLEAINISIHALREERDYCKPRIQDSQPISIHALREERDSKKTQNRRAFFVINIEYYESFR